MTLKFFHRGVTLITRQLPMVFVLLPTAGALRADEAEDRNKVEDMRVSIPAEVRAVRSVEKLGGKVERDVNSPDKPVVVVDLPRSRVTDAELKELTELKQLQKVVLHCPTRVTDKGIWEFPNALPDCRIIIFR